jgi:integrase
MHRKLAELIDTEKGNMPRQLDEFAKTYLPTQSPSWRKETERMLGKLKIYFSNFNVNQVEPTDVQDLVNHFELAKESARKHKGMLSKFFRWAIVIKRLRTDNPCRDVKVEGGKKKLMVWSPDVFYSIRDALGISDEAEMMRCYLDLSFLLYQRSTDARILERRHIDDKHILVAPTKTRKSSGVEIEIPVTPELQDVLDRAAAISRKWNIVCPYVIHTRKGDTYTRSGIYSAFKRAGERVSIKGADPKSVRKFAANEAKRAGYDMEQIQDALGHNNISTTQGYVLKSTRRQSVVRLVLPERPVK